MKIRLCAVLNGNPSNQALARNRNLAPDIIRFRISTYLAHPNQ